MWVLLVMPVMRVMQKMQVMHLLQVVQVMEDMHARHVSQPNHPNHQSYSSYCFRIFHVLMKSYQMVLIKLHLIWNISCVFYFWQHLDPFPSLQARPTSNHLSTRLGWSRSNIEAKQTWLRIDEQNISHCS